MAEFNVENAEYLDEWFAESDGKNEADFLGF